MPRQARSKLIDPAESQVIHCVQHCVRRATLLGDNPITGKDCCHRKEWVRERLQLLASVFGIDCLTYAVQSDGFHLVLRSRPDVVKSWKDEEVARRWLQLFRKNCGENDASAEPTEKEIKKLTRSKKGLAILRERLGNISWWMRCLSENIARRANKEDECRGRFWDGRFKAQLLLDDEAILACAAYVDVAPVRAAFADPTEEKTLSGCDDRLRDSRQSKRRHAKSRSRKRSRRKQRGNWLGGFQLAPRPEAPIRKELPPKALTAYQKLITWTRARVRDKTSGRVPIEVKKILSSLSLEADQWIELISRFDDIFGRAVGTADSLRREAANRDQDWMNAPGNPLGAPA